MKTDKELLKALHDRLDWDGNGYWLPNICIKEKQFESDLCPLPTFEEFIIELNKEIERSEEND